MSQARKTFKIAWEPEFPRKIAFEHFEVKRPPITGTYPGFFQGGVNFFSGGPSYLTVLKTAQS